MSGKHLAALLPQQGGPLFVQERTTPEPGPNDILIEVKAVALNPIDYYQRDFGMPPVPLYPAVLGCDVAGLVAKVGSNVKTTPPIGSRVIAFASAFYQDGKPNYGAFQQYALAQSEVVIALPDSISLESSAVLPVAVLTALTAYTTVGIPIGTRYSPEDKQAILVWGAASSVGTLAVQTAKSMGFIVYATASTKNHAYIKQLGADAVFDYKDSDVVSQIISAMTNDGVNLHTAHCVVDGGLQPTLDVLKATKGDTPAKVTHSPMLPEGHPTLENTEIKFNFPSLDKKERDDHFHDCFHGWLAEGFKAGTVVPSPPAQVEGQSLEAVDKALDTLKAGVSCKKIVVSI